MPVYLLDESLHFPPPHLANEEGILAVGGDLSPDRLLLAYKKGIFPWYEEGAPLLWWSPDPRMVLFPNDLKISKSMRLVLRKNIFHITFDSAFQDVVRSCQKQPRKGQHGTWITEHMITAYTALHEKGLAHSVEVWEGDNLAGGLYGVSLGKAFFGESMFSRVSNASKAGFIALVNLLSSKGFRLIDCQVYTEHLESLGAQEVPRDHFLRLLKESLEFPTWQGKW